MGVTSGFAGLKFSTSPSAFGLFETMMIIRRAVQHMGLMSFTVNIG